MDTRSSGPAGGAAPTTPWWHAAALVLAIFTGLGLLFSTQTYLDSFYTRGAVSLRQAIVLALAGWYGWAVLSPVLVWLARRFPLARPHRTRDAAVHLVASLVLTFGKLGATGMLLGAAGFGPRHVTSTIHIPLNYVTYWAIVGVVWSVDLMRQQRAARLRAAELEASLATARLDALTLQLQPHFLFNTLNSVAELMHENVDAAERMVGRLSRLLRASLDGPAGHEVALDQELAFLEEYLGIERIRFEDRLRVDMRIDPAARQGLVPRLLLQPLVENAVRHAVAPRAAGGTIAIDAARRGDRLALRIADDGPPRTGAATALTAATGVGLGNTKARLSTLYDGDHTFEIRERPAGGVEVRIELPFRGAAPDSPA
jgi:signal transduction histidine kinase